MKYVLAIAPLCSLLLFTSCSQSPQKLLATADKYHHNKKYKEASILYQKAIAKDKTNAAAYYGEGINLIDEGQPSEAAKFLRRAVDLQPTNSDAATKLAEIYLAAYAHNPRQYKSLLSDAQDLTTKMLQQDPNSFDGNRLQGLIDLANRDTNKALAAFAKANQIKPYSRELIGWYAQALAASGSADKGIQLVQDMLAHDKTWGPGYDFLFLQYSRQHDAAKSEAILRERVQYSPNDPVAIQNLANFLLAMNRFPEAESLMKRVVDDKKDFPNGRLLMGDFYLRARKFDDALQQYQAGTNEDSKNSLRYQERVIQVYSLENHRDKALQLAKTLAAKNPKDSSINQVYATLLLQTGTRQDLAQSLTELQKLVQNNPAEPALHLDLARAYFGLNQMDKSLAEALEAFREDPRSIPARVIAARIYEDRGQHGKAIEQTDLILQADPRNPDARLIRDRALVGMNEADRALPELEQLAKEYPQIDEVHLLLANLYMAGKQYDKAQQQFQQIWTANPPDPRGFVGMQSIKLAQGHADQAIQTMQEMAEKNPNVPAYKFELAGFQAVAGSQMLRTDPARAKQYFQEAEGNYKDLLKNGTKSYDIWLRLGVLQRQLGESDAALASFEEASKANPRSADALLNQGMLLESMGKKKEARDIYNKVLGIDSENTLALNNLAFLDADANTNLDQAMTFAERAKKQVPNNADISDTLGYVYLQKNLNSEALRIFRQVVQDQPQNATFRLHLAMALLKQGDKQAARDEAQKALRTASHPEEQDKIRSFVTQIG